MKRLIGVLAALFVVSVVAAPFVQAADDYEGRGNGPERARRAWAGRRPHDGGPEGAEADGAKHHPRPAKLAAHLLIAAVSAPWAKDDAELQELVDKAMSDRKIAYKAQGDRMKAFDVVLKGFRNGKTREELEDEIEALKAADEALREAAKTLREDLRAIHERMKELRPERPGNAGADGMRPEGRGNRPRRARGDEATDDLPPEIY